AFRNGGAVLHCCKLRTLLPTAVQPLHRLARLLERRGVLRSAVPIERQLRCGIGHAVAASLAESVALAKQAASLTTNCHPAQRSCRGSRCAVRRALRPRGSRVFLPLWYWAGRKECRSPVARYLVPARHGNQLCR